MSVYTRTGDDGTTGLIGGTRVQKYDLRLEAYGTVDELNSWIGLIRSREIYPDDMMCLIEIQKKLFVIGAHLATDTSKVDIPAKLPCCEDDIIFLERSIDRILGCLPEVTMWFLIVTLREQCADARNVGPTGFLPKFPLHLKCLNILTDCQITCTHCHEKWQEIWGLKKFRGNHKKSQSGLFY
jgi:hypothetical protein